MRMDGRDPQPAGPRMVPREFSSAGTPSTSELASTTGLPLTATGPDRRPATPANRSANCELCQHRTGANPNQRTGLVPRWLAERVNESPAVAGERTQPQTSPLAELSRGLRFEMVKFAVAGVIALAVVGASAALFLRHLGTKEALTDAAVLSSAIAHNVVEPALTDAALDGDAEGLTIVGSALHDWLYGGPITGMKLWSSGGVPLLTMGSGPSREEDEALERWTDAEVRTQIPSDRNVLVRTGEEAVEVYQRLRSPSGREAMLELSIADSSVSAGSRRVWLAFLPAFLLGLVVLQLAQMPIAWALASRVRRGEAARAGLTRRAVESSDHERRRIAGVIHDRVIHDLTGRGLSLDAAAQQAERHGQVGLAETIANAASATRQSVRDLRTLLVDIYPPDLHSRGLDVALSDLVEPLAAVGIDARLENHQTAPPGRLAQAIVYRIAKESLENVLRHSRARGVRMSLLVSTQTVVLTVADDGCGFSPDESLARPDGHFGLRLLTDLCAAAGGVLHVESTCGQGTRVHAEVPNQ